jgi:DNA-binding transcriptional regulator YdaS (Cro superfamily)
MVTAKTAAGPRLSHAMVVELLGGMTVIAPAVGIRKPNTVAHWKKPGRGIPPLYWPAIERMAAAKGWKISCADLEATSPHAVLRSVRGDDIRAQRAEYRRVLRRSKRQQAVNGDGGAAK